MEFGTIGKWPFFLFGKMFDCSALSEILNAEFSGLKDTSQDPRALYFKF